MANEDALSQFENAEITELDDGDLSGAAGGVVLPPGESGTNGNCNCAPGTSPPAGYTNGNCSCSGTSES